MKLLQQPLLVGYWQPVEARVAAQQSLLLLHRQPSMLIEPVPQVPRRRDSRIRVPRPSRCCIRCGAVRRAGIHGSSSLRGAGLRSNLSLTTRPGLVLRPARDLRTRGRSGRANGRAARMLASSPGRGYWHAQRNQHRRQRRLALPFRFVYSSHVRSPAHIYRACLPTRVSCSSLQA
jgi:hypothetical protein